ncbi:MAG: inositol monophosphatase family protein [Candidatus Eremiobacteraeota bacterium]|nr:inositol monophosphatase family protein [Candidatus Eremiobacteraeota bacterium]
MDNCYQEELAAAISAVREAGVLLRKDFHRSDGPLGSGDQADIDRKAEMHIREMLQGLRPLWGFRGEETGDRGGKDREGHLWLVDPNDGTEPYLQGYRGSAVSIALLRGGKPVLGVVYSPFFPDDRGDLISWAEGCGPLSRNGDACSEKPLQGNLQHDAIVLVSHKGDTKSGANGQLVHPARFIALPSIAYRMALVAAGDALGAVSLNSPCDYDYAGGHALLCARGGSLVNEKGKPVAYTSSGRSSVHYCFAGPSHAVVELAGRDWRGIFSSRESKSHGYDPLEPRRGGKMEDPGILARAQGCLLGQLAGDSLGSLVEFMSPEDIRDAYPQGVRVLHNGGTFHTIAGQPTDDSEMALMLARTLVKRGTYDPDETAKAYVYWHDSGPFDMGTTTRWALSALKSSTGEKALSVASREAFRDSQANGSLMRVSPLGIWGWDLAPEELAACARQDSSLTHQNQVCQDACAVFTVAIARAIAAGGGAEEVYRFAEGFAEKNACAPVLETLRNAAKEPPKDLTKQMGWVLLAFQNAFYQLLHAENMEEGVVDTVMRGGDTDTNAAIAGALLGALYGRSAVPLQWRQMVLSCRPIAGMEGVLRPRPWSFWPVDALELAERLLTARQEASGRAGPR